MLKIRLQRIGRKNDPAFRVVVTESTRGPKSGKYVELLGSYNPRQHIRTFKSERIKHWISRGAQVSGTVHNLLIHENILEGKKINVLPRKSPVVQEEKEKVVDEKEDEGKEKGDAETALPPVDTEAERGAEDASAVEKEVATSSEENVKGETKEEEQVKEESEAKSVEEDKPKA